MENETRRPNTQDLPALSQLIRDSRNPGAVFTAWDKLTRKHKWSKKGNLEEQGGDERCRVRRHVTRVKTVIRVRDRREPGTVDRQLHVPWEREEDGQPASSHQPSTSASPRGARGFSTGETPAVLISAQPLFHAEQALCASRLVRWSDQTRWTPRALQLEPCRTCVFPCASRGLSQNSAGCPRGERLCSPVAREALVLFV